MRRSRLNKGSRTEGHERRAGGGGDREKERKEREGERVQTDEERCGGPRVAPREFVAKMAEVSGRRS